jgi:MFS family permease
MAEATVVPGPTVEAPPPAGRNEWLLVAFTASTNVADAVARVALPLLAVRLTRSPALVALVAVLMTLPWLVTALHVGVLVDRHNRRSLMVGAETARMVAIGGLLVAYLAGAASLPLIYVVAAALGVAEVVAMTAGASIIPSAVPRTRWSAASARITAVEYLCNGFVGAPIGGFLVAAGFALAPATRRPARVEIREGLAFLWRHRLLRTMALLIAVMAGCWSAWLAIIPAYAVGGALGLDERGYGLLLTSLGAGGVVGALVVGRVNRWLGRRWSMFVDIVGSCALVAAPAVVPPGPGGAAAIGAAAFLAGVGGTMWTVNARVIYQSLVPDEMLGRFSAASRLVGWGATPVAAAVAGVLAGAVGYRVAFAVFAVVCAALAIPYLRILTREALDGVLP